MGRDQKKVRRREREKERERERYIYREERRVEQRRQE